MRFFTLRPRPTKIFSKTGNQHLVLVLFHVKHRLHKPLFHKENNSAHAGRRPRVFGAFARYRRQPRDCMREKCANSKHVFHRDFAGIERFSPLFNKRATTRNGIFERPWRGTIRKPMNEAGHHTPKKLIGGALRLEPVSRTLKALSMRLDMVHQILAATKSLTLRRSSCANTGALPVQVSGVADPGRRSRKTRMQRSLYSL